MKTARTITDPRPVPGTVVIEGDCDLGRLVSLLATAGVTAAPAAAPDGRTLLIASAPGHDGEAAPGLLLRTREHRGPDLEWWAASRILRRLRTVADAEGCASPGLASVLDTRTWTHPDVAARAAGEPVAAEGVVVFKPGVRVLPATLRELAVRLAECGYRAARARVLSGEEIRSGDLAARHYLPHLELAERGAMSVHERADFLRLYDRPEFVGRFGERPYDLPVLPARAVSDELGVPFPLLDRWSGESTLRHGLDSGVPDGPNGIGDCLYVNVFQHPDYNAGRAFVVLNPHLPGVLESLRDTGNETVAVLVEACSRTPLAWHRMRREFCGVTDPERAVPGSLRGDARAGELALRNMDGSPVRRTNNGVHLSNGAVEALQDTMTWFGIPAGRTVAGLRLRAGGIDPDRLLEAAFVGLAGRRRAVQEVTDGASAAEAVRVLRGGPLIRHSDAWDDPRSRRLIDVAWRCTARLRSDPGVVAVFVAGSAGRGRTLSGTGLDLLVVRDADARPGGDVDSPGAGVEIGVRTLSFPDALSAVTEPPGSLDALAVAGSLAGVVLWERDGEGERLRTAATSLRVPAAVRHAELDRIGRILADGHADGLREGALALAALTLSLHPVRWHTHAWALTDLVRAGRPKLRDLLADAWSVRGVEEAGVRAALTEARLLAAGADGGLAQSLRTAVRDACELAGERRFEEALYRLRLAAWTGTRADDGGRAVPGALLPAVGRPALGAALTAYARGLRDGDDA